MLSMKKPPLAFEALAAAAGTAAFYGIKDFLPAGRRRGWLRGAALVAGIAPYVARSTVETMEFAKEEFSQASRQTAELRKILDDARARQQGFVPQDGDVADLAAGEDVAVDGDAFNDDVLPDGAVDDGAVGGGAVDEDGEGAEEIWPPNDPKWWDRVFSLPPYAVLPGAAAVLVLAVTVGVRIDRAIQRAGVKALESRGVEYPNAAWGVISGVIGALAVVADRKTQERAVRG